MKERGDAQPREQERGALQGGLQEPQENAPGDRFHETVPVGAGMRAGRTSCGDNVRWSSVRGCHGRRRTIVCVGQTRRGLATDGTQMKHGSKLDDFMKLDLWVVCHGERVVVDVLLASSVKGVVSAVTLDNKEGSNGALGGWAARSLTSWSTSDLTASQSARRRSVSPASSGSQRRMSSSSASRLVRSSGDRFVDSSWTDGRFPGRRRRSGLAYAVDRLTAVVFGFAFVAPSAADESETDGEDWQESLERVNVGGGHHARYSGRGVSSSNSSTTWRGRS